MTINATQQQLQDNSSETPGLDLQFKVKHLNTPKLMENGNTQSSEQLQSKENAKKIIKICETRIEALSEEINKQKRQAQELELEALLEKGKQKHRENLKSLLVQDVASTESPKITAEKCSESQKPFIKQEPDCYVVEKAPPKTNFLKSCLKKKPSIKSCFKKRSISFNNLVEVRTISDCKSSLEADHSTDGSPEMFTKDLSLDRPLPYKGLKSLSEIISPGDISEHFIQSELKKSDKRNLSLGIVPEKQTQSTSDKSGDIEQSKGCLGDPSEASQELDTNSGRHLTPAESLKINTDPAIKSAKDKPKDVSLDAEDPSVGLGPLVDYDSVVSDPSIDQVDEENKCQRKRKAKKKKKFDDKANSHKHLVDENEHVGSGGESKRNSRRNLVKRKKLTRVTDKKKKKSLESDEEPNSHIVENKDAFCGDEFNRYSRRNVVKRKSLASVTEKKKKSLESYDEPNSHKHIIENEDVGSGGESNRNSRRNLVKRKSLASVTEKKKKSLESDEFTNSHKHIIENEDVGARLKANSKRNMAKKKPSTTVTDKENTMPDSEVSENECDVERGSKSRDSMIPSIYATKISKSNRIEVSGRSNASDESIGVRPNTRRNKGNRCNKSSRLSLNSLQRNVGDTSSPVKRFTKIKTKKKTQNDDLDSESDTGNTKQQPLSRKQRTVRTRKNDQIGSETYKISHKDQYDSSETEIEESYSSPKRKRTNAVNENDSHHKENKSQARYFREANKYDSTDEINNTVGDLSEEQNLHRKVNTRYRKRYDSSREIDTITNLSEKQNPCKKPKTKHRASGSNNYDTSEEINTAEQRPLQRPQRRLKRAVCRDANFSSEDDVHHRKTVSRRCRRDDFSESTSSSNNDQSFGDESRVQKEKLIRIADSQLWYHCESTKNAQLKVQSEEKVQDRAILKHSQGVKRMECRKRIAQETSDFSSDLSARQAQSTQSEEKVQHATVIKNSYGREEMKDHKQTTQETSDLSTLEEVDENVKDMIQERNLGKGDFCRVPRKRANEGLKSCSMMRKRRRGLSMMEVIFIFFIIPIPFSH